MASSQEDGAAAAAEQLGSMTLSGSEERTDDETTAENGTPAAKFCSTCGEKSDTLKKCTACKCIWYCDKECQNKHRKEHKKECRPIKKELGKRGGKLDLGTELDVGPLGKLPQREECPICMRAVPIHAALRSYFACCGKTICCGCVFHHKIRILEQAAERGQKPETVVPTCAFCREPMPTSNEEMLARTRKRVERNDPVALCNLAMAYGDGDFGLPVDQPKCTELLRQSAGLGYPIAHYQLGNFHDDGAMGLEQNEEKVSKYYKEAAESGHIAARHNLGCIEANSNGNFVAAMGHWRLSASEGERFSMESLIICFGNGLLHHGDLAETLQAMYLARAEMKSEDRDQYIAYLKKTGEYREEYER